MHQFPSYALTSDFLYANRSRAWMPCPALLTCVACITVRHEVLYQDAETFQPCDARAGDYENNYQPRPWGTFCHLSCVVTSQRKWTDHLPAGNDETNQSTQRWLSYGSCRHVALIVNAGVAIKCSRYFRKGSSKNKPTEAVRIFRSCKGLQQQRFFDAN